MLLLVGLALALLAVTLLFMRLGQAHGLRTESQNAADAAALAAAGQAADEAARDIANYVIPYSSLHDPATARTRAEEYARDNGAVLEDIRASDDNTGNTGNIVRVEVRSAQCQRELEEHGDRHWNDTVCDGTEDEEDEPLHTGNADAIAEVVIPDCSYIVSDGEDVSIIGIRCDGETVQSYTHARRLIEVELTDEEGQYIYKPLSWTEDG
ncbi:pilus assembly protein TadG-related protein [Halostreptopolyspora alba]